MYVLKKKWKKVIPLFYREKYRKTIAHLILPYFYTKKEKLYYIYFFLVTAIFAPCSQN